MGEGDAVLVRRCPWNAAKLRIAVPLSEKARNRNVQVCDDGDHIGYLC